MRWSRQGLLAEGFEGFVSWTTLRQRDLPGEGGVYVVLHESGALPEFLDKSVGGHFKAKDPTVAVRVLAKEWIEGAQVVYIGKATSLRNRIWQYRQFGVGRPIGHWGGRYVWQLDESENLAVAWRTTPDQDPRDVERALIADFVRDYGRRPFANLSG